MIRAATWAILAWTSLTSAAAEPTDASNNPAASSREFRFTYAGSIANLPPGKPVRVWLPVPPSNTAQSVELLDSQIPAEVHLGKDATYGNNIL